MKVILLADVRNVGHKNEVCEVADGFARNFLIARKLAVAADQKGMAIKESADAKERAAKDRLQVIANSIAATKFEVTIKTGQHKEVFGSVSKRDIEVLLKQKGITEGEVLLNHPIKSTGEHKVEVDLGKGIKGIANIIVKTQ